MSWKGGESLSSVQKNVGSSISVSYTHLFGMARAFGEALAIQMVVGNSAVVPTSLTTPAATLTSVLTMGIGNTVMGTVDNNVLWSLALVLLLMSLAFNSVIKLITKERGKKNYAR